MMFLKRPLLGLPILAVLTLLIAPAAAFAADAVPPTQPTLTLPSIQFWSAVIGAATVGLGYAVNYFGKWTSEPVKLGVQAVLIAGVNVIYQLVQVGDFALDTRHLQLVGTAMLLAIPAHFALKAGNVNTLLGGGRNRADEKGQ